MFHRAKDIAPPLSQPHTGDLESRTQAIGRELLAATRAVGPSTISAQFWSDKLISGALSNERFKTELFRFVDVFPVLKTPQQIHQHLHEYLDQPGIELPTGMGLALKAGGLLKGTLAKTVASQIESMARTFIAGENIQEALPKLESRWRENIAFSVDLLGEACVSHAEAAAYINRYHTLINELPALIAKWPANSQLERDHLGTIPRANVSIKISALDGHVSPVDTEGSLDRLVANLKPLLQLAAKNNVLINFDMEQHALKDLTFRLFKRCCEQFDFDAGLAVQAYLKSADADARDLVEWARSRGRIVTVRLIKGAYWDYETIHAQMMGWPVPVWEKKAETDACFERVTSYLIHEMPRTPGKGCVKLALGTHNVRSVAHAIASLEMEHLPQNAIEFQALRGMAEELKTALAARGWRVREYMPIGEMIPGMAYLVRRLLENTSNQGWLRAGQTHSDDAALLAPPAASLPRAERSAKDAFENEPLRDFSEPRVREAFAHAVTKSSVNPVANDGTEAMAAEAIARASKAYPAWRDTPATERIRIIQKAAAILRENRDRLCAIVIQESHKTWAEADADVCEAIDFCEFYAVHALPLFTPRALRNLTGERNEQIHEPRGVAAVIAPWNFPLSIPTGMTVAALVTGNAAILKPAEQTPVIAHELCKALWQAGIPKDVLQFLPGPGETVGAALVRDPRVAIIAFTGSAAVGLNILKEANARPPTQHSELSTQHFVIPRIIAELGGKNALIIDDSADLDEAVLGTRQSAFGYAGQKCSAGSRAIILESIHDNFVTRLIESTKALTLGDPRNPATDIGPVIDAAAAEKIRHYIALGKQEATLALPTNPTQHSALSTQHLIPPHIFTNVLPTHRIARDEIFGPVLAILKARDFDHALQLANDSPYKLTGGIYSRTPSHLDRARREFRVGNLYINRGITGALVGRQPFGGFGMSGAGSKAGGIEYLLHFVDTRVITENTLRRGFAPEQ
jgi:RHH-type transcriptional regulator, proline utilization regulon repressor / proline dehydrogenase / delta 1-pyrroline-5-carboxylate dehydrogenase